jgi:arylsulfatase A
MKTKMKITQSIVATVGSFAMLCGAARADTPTTRPSKPNIIFVLADDLGIDGVSAYGAQAHSTPHIDALASTGIKFTTAYAAPLCGPSRCLLMTGRYAFRTGGLTNQSWRPNGPGAKSADEYPMARVLKEAGYATCQAGKWRQIGELPGNWGFDEFLTDNTASGWYWQTNYIKNGKTVVLPDGSYGPDVIQDFAFDFIHRHKDGPFFLYYAMHLVHKPTLRTPDTSANTKDIKTLYDDNIKYMDKQVGLLVDELEKLGLRKNTLLVFSGDNGTAAGYPAPVNGRMLNGWKGSMLEGGSRVPFIVSWPGVTPSGKVLDDLVSFADPLATFADIAGAKLPENFKTDGHSIAPQILGQPGTQRPYAYVQLGRNWFVREPGYKLNQAGQLFDMSDAPFTEKLVAPADDTDASKAARARLTAALAELNPAGGKVDAQGEGPGGAAAAANAPKAPWKSGDELTGAQAPAVAGKPLDITAEIEPAGTDGVIVTQGGRAQGYALYLSGGKLAFALREGGQLTTVIAKDALGSGHLKVEATLDTEGKIALLVDGKQIADGKADGPIPQQPKAGLIVGSSRRGGVGEYQQPATFSGKISNVQVKAGDGE